MKHILVVFFSLEVSYSVHVQCNPKAQALQISSLHKGTS